MAAFIPGWIEINVSNSIKGGGAIAVFLIVYFYSPAKLVYQPTVPAYGDELSFVTDDMVLQLSSTNSDEINTDLDDSPRKYQIFFTIGNQHPFEKYRVTKIRPFIIDQRDTVAFCCPETRSLFKMEIDLQSANTQNKPSLETVELPTLSTHSFVADIDVIPGVPDRDPYVWLGLEVDYVGPDGARKIMRSDKVYLVNFETTGSYNLVDLKKYIVANDGQEPWDWPWEVPPVGKAIEWLENGSNLTSLRKLNITLFVANRRELAQVN